MGRHNECLGLFRVPQTWHRTILEAQDVKVDNNSFLKLLGCRVEGGTTAKQIMDVAWQNLEGNGMCGWGS